MSITKISIPDFLFISKKHPVLDVRSPGEYKHAHMPNAYSLPLFTDEERKVVGTAYNQQSKQQAVRIGLEYFGKKMVLMLDEATTFVKSFYSKQAASPHDNTVIVHCWRGGMRSAGVAWLLDLYGFKVYTIIGGYKAYRKWVLHQFEHDYDIKVLGGYTGAGKTCLINCLRKVGQSVINLEALAAHKGSAFGALGMPQQPTQEMFENLLADELAAISNANYTWLEDESRRIGQLGIPAPFYDTMQRKPLYFIDIPFNNRLSELVAAYGYYDKALLADAILRIQKRLGGLETKNALRHLDEGNMEDCFRILLTYYDKCYTKGLITRGNANENIIKIVAEQVDVKKNAALLLRAVTQNNDRNIYI